MKRLQPTQRMSKDMHARAHAAVELVKMGRLDGPLALSYVVWPSQAIVERQAA